MAASPLESEVIDLIAGERGLPRHKVTLSSRLLQDLGMDGDDAVEFFLAFEKAYGADLEPLYRHWDRHFGPEGCGGGPIMFLILLLLLAAPFPLLPLGVDPFWVWGLELVALLLWLWPLRQWPFKDRMIPVTVNDVVVAAGTGRWPIRYEEEAEPRP